MNTAGNISAPPSGGWKEHRAELLIAGSVFVVAILLCAPALQLLSSIWSRSQFYGHGYAIPAVTGFLLYRNRREIGKVLQHLRPPLMGPLIVFGAGVMEVLLVMGDVGFGAQLGIPCLLAATAYGVGGFPLLRPMAVPLGFLVFMVPPPNFLIHESLFRLKLFVTQAALYVLQLGGQTVAADGNRVLLPGHTLFVADACSGLTSIVTLLPLAWIVAYFLSRGVWRRVLILASTVPLAVGANILRVIITVQMVSTYGVEFAQGLLHESFGLATYIVGTLVLIGVAKALR